MRWHWQPATAVTAAEVEEATKCILQEAWEIRLWQESISDWPKNSVATEEEKQVAAYFAYLKRIRQDARDDWSFAEHILLLEKGGVPSEEDIRLRAYYRYLERMEARRQYSDECEMQNISFMQSRGYAPRLAGA